MPAFVLSIVSMAAYIRYLRASMIEVLHDDLHPHRAGERAAGAGRSPGGTPSATRSFRW